jgi:PAS domain-containing protein
MPKTLSTLDFDPIGFTFLKDPIWVFDLYNFGVIWANETALGFWRASDIGALSARDMAPMSDTTRAKFRSYTERLGAGETIESDWTLYPDNIETTVRLRFVGVPVSGDRIALLCQLIEPHRAAEIQAPGPISQDERAQDRDGLAEAEARLLSFAESGSDWFWETDPIHDFIYLSENVGGVA